MGDEPLRASQATRARGTSTEELLVLLRDGKIRGVMEDGIAHVPADAVDECAAAG